MDIDNNQVAELLTNLARRFRSLERHYQNITHHYEPHLDLSQLNLTTRGSLSPTPNITISKNNIVSPQKLGSTIESIVQGARKRMIGIIRFQGLKEQVEEIFTEMTIQIQNKLQDNHILSQPQSPAQTRAASVMAENKEKQSTEIRQIRRENHELRETITSLNENMTQLLDKYATADKKMQKYKETINNKQIEIARLRSRLSSGYKQAQSGDYSSSLRIPNKGLRTPSPNQYINSKYQSPSEEYIAHTSRY